MNSSMAACSLYTGMTTVTLTVSGRLWRANARRASHGGDGTEDFCWLIVKLLTLSSLVELELGSIT